EIRGKSRRNRILSKQSRAETVDRGNPCPLDCLPQRRLSFKTLDQPLLDLCRRFLGKCDRENPAGVDVLFFHQPCEALDQDARFPGPWSCDDTNILAASFRRGALGRRQNDGAPAILIAACDSTRHMSRKSHHTHFFSSAGRVAISPFVIDSKTSLAFATAP